MGKILKIESLDKSKAQVYDEYNGTLYTTIAYYLRDRGVQEIKKYAKESQKKKKNWMFTFNDDEFRATTALEYF